MRLAAFRSRAPLLIFALALILALVATLAMMDRAALERLRHELHSNVTQDEARVAKLAAIEQSVRALESTPTALSQIAFADIQATLVQRLERLESAASDAAQARDLGALREQVHALQARAKSRSTRPAEPAGASLTPFGPKSPTPPFTVLGNESRGGEQFLTLIPAGAQALGDIRVLRVGESLGDWHVERIEKNAVVFRVQGQQQRLPLP
jgi:hypothetical protein